VSIHHRISFEVEADIDISDIPDLLDDDEDKQWLFEELGRDLSRSDKSSHTMMCDRIRRELFSNEEWQELKDAIEYASIINER